MLAYFLMAVKNGNSKQASVAANDAICLQDNILLLVILYASLEIGMRSRHQKSLTSSLVHQRIIVS